MVKKYVLVSGGVISGIGKGIIASSTGLLLKTMGLKVTSIKIDPYLNIDAGTLSPLDHGNSLIHLKLIVRSCWKKKVFYNLSGVVTIVVMAYL
jgi:hypothetical protein